MTLRGVDRGVFLGAAALLVVSVAAPFLALAGADAGRLALAAVEGLCHQIPARSFHLVGHTMALCARCTGVYGGLALTWWMLRRVEEPWEWRRSLTPGATLLAVALMAVMAGEWTLARHIPAFSANPTRLLSGLAFGAGWVLGPHRWLLAAAARGSTLLRLPA